MLHFAENRIFAVLFCALLMLCTINIVEAKSDEEIYQDKLSQLKPDDIKGHYDLGLWCKQNKLLDEAREEFKKVIKLNPTHAESRKELNYVKYNDEWITEEEKDERIAKEKGLVRYGDKWVTPKEMESLREKERKSLKWDFDYKIQTKHYIIYASTTEEEVKIVGQLAECLYDAFVKYFNMSDIHSYFKMKVFKDKNEFNQRIPNKNKLSWRAGTYDAQNGFCYFFPDNKAPNIMYAYNCLFHEGTHQLICELLKTKFPKWLDEGLAEYFALTGIKDNKLVLGKIDAAVFRASWAERFGEQVSDIRKILCISSTKEWEEAKNPKIQYSAVWSFVHFLFHYQNGLYKEKFLAYMKYLADISKNPKIKSYNQLNVVDLKSFEQIVGNIDKLNSEWLEYIKKLPISD
jgi:hypothetical protein